MSMPLLNTSVATRTRVSLDLNRNRISSLSLCSRSDEIPSVFQDFDFSPLTMSLTLRLVEEKMRILFSSGRSMISDLTRAVFWVSWTR